MYEIMQIYGHVYSTTNKQIINFVVQKETHVPCKLLRDGYRLKSSRTFIPII